MKTKTAVLKGKTDAANPHVWFGALYNAGYPIVNRLCVVGSVALLAMTAAGEDWTVTDAQTLTRVTNVYDNVTISGNLTVGAGAKLQCKTALVVGPIGGETATLTVQDGGYVEVNGTAYFAKAGGQAQITIAADSKIAVGGDTYLAYGYDAQPAATDPKAHCRLDVSGLLECQGVVYAASGNMVPYPGQYTSWNQAATDVDTDIWLNEGGEFLLHKFQKNCPANDVSGGSQDLAGRTLQQCFHFNGGRLRQYVRSSGANYGDWFVQAWTPNMQAFVRLISENGNDIAFSVETVNVLFTSGSTTTTYTLEGSGDFVKSGVGNVTFCNYADSANVGNYDNWNTQSYGVGKLSRKNFTGAIRVKEGQLRSYRTSDWCDNAAPVRKLIVEQTGQFDFNGCDISVTEFQGWGPVTNSSATAATLTLNTGANDIYLYTLSPRLNVVNNGSGKLTTCAESAGLGTITLNGGDLVLKSRKEFGYNFYRFRTVGARQVGVSNGQVRIREFYYLDGDTDVTAGYDSYVHIPRWTSYYTLAPAMWDRNLNTYYKDQQAQNASALNWLYVTIGFKPARKVTGYKWNTETQATCPTNWVFMGGHTDYPVDYNYNNNGSDKGWIVLDRRQDDSVGAYQETPKYEIPYPAEAALDLENVTLANGAKLTVDGANLTLAAASLAGATVKAGFGARLTLPSAGSQTSLEIDASADGAATIVNFNPAAVGAVRVRGWTKTAPKTLPLQFENLGSEPNLAAWPVYLDDATAPSRYRIILENGYARLQSTSGLVLLYR